MEGVESLEALQARHRKEQRDLVAKTTQKKKSATKKTRKGVNDECERLEQEMKERQAKELAALNGQDTNEPEPTIEEDDGVEGDSEQANGVAEAVEALSLSSQQDTSTQESQAPKKKQNRAKARLARRAAEQEALATQAAEEAANLPDLREQERERMHSHFGKYGLQEKEIRADGHCLYAAVADQMENQGLGLKPKIDLTIADMEGELPPYKKVRHTAAAFIARNPDDFVPFMEEPLDDYLHKIRDTGEWGGHMELIALAKTFGVTINVLHGDGSVNKIDPEAPVDEERQLWLGYYRHNFGLGEHYNSLRKTP